MPQHPQDKWLKNYLSFIFKEFIQQNTLYSAGALTFTTLLSLVPLIAVSFSIFRIFPAFSSFEQLIEQFLYQQLVPSSASVVQNYLQEFVAKANQLTIWGSMFLVITSLLTIMTIEDTFNHIWHVRSKRGLSAFLLYWALLTLAPFALGLGLLSISYFISIPLIASAISQYAFLKSLISVGPALLAVVGCMLIYKIIPNSLVLWRHAFIGAVIIGILFELSKRVFSWYLSFFNTYEFLYGAVAIVPIFLVWLYIMWLLVLIGAHITHGLSFSHKKDAFFTEHPWVIIYLWLGYFWQAQAKGKSLSLTKLAELSNIDERSHPEDLIQHMIDTNIISMLDNGDFVLVRDLNNFSLNELYRCLPWKLPQQSDLKEINIPWANDLRDILNNADNVLNQALQQNLASLYEKYS